MPAFSLSAGPVWFPLKGSRAVITIDGRHDLTQIKSALVFRSQSVELGSGRTEGDSTSLEV